MAAKKTPSEHMPEPDVEVPEAVESAAEVEAIVRKVHGFNVKRWNDVLRRSEEANDGMTPTVDRQGRFHAPKDGYIDPDSDRIYRGGSYLPFPEEYYMDGGELRFRGGSFSSSKGWRYQERIRMSKADAGALMTISEELIAKENGAFSGYFEVSMGKAWEEGDITVCYAYIKAAYKPVLEAILRFASKHEHKRPVVEPVVFPVWPEERRKITGTIISTKAYPSSFGGSSVWKMLVQADDGNKTFGSHPTSLAAHAGDRVEFEAKVVMKEPGFYYFKNPKNAGPSA